MQTSFYGGLPGYSFFIAKAYGSEDDMIADFNREDCSVHYGEYVLITAELQDTNPDGTLKFENGKPVISTNHVKRAKPENGRLYYRGVDGKPVYKGTIIGATGRAPHLVLDKYDNIEATANDPVNPAPPDRQAHNTLNIADADLLPGKDPATGTFNDEIYWYSVSMDYDDGTTNESSETYAYLGFKIPFPIFEFVGTRVRYNKEEIEITQTNLDANNIPEHPFYHTFDIDIPNGTPGDKIVEVSIVDRDSLRNDDKTIDNENYTKVVGYRITRYSLTDPTDEGITDPVGEYRYGGFVEGYSQLKVCEDGSTALMGGHLLGKNLDTTKNVIEYMGEYWEDLGFVDAFDVEKVHSDITQTTSGGQGVSAGASDDDVKAYLSTHSPYNIGLQDPFKGSAVLHENEDGEKEAWYYNWAEGEWEKTGVFGGGSGGGGGSISLSIDNVQSLTSTIPAGAANPELIVTMVKTIPTPYSSASYTYNDLVGVNQTLSLVDGTEITSIELISADNQEGKVPGKIESNGLSYFPALSENATWDNTNQTYVKDGTKVQVTKNYAKPQYSDFCVEYSFHIPEKMSSKVGAKLLNKTYSVAVSTNLPSDMVFIKSIVADASGNLDIVLRIPYVDSNNDIIELSGRPYHENLSSISVIYTLLRDPLRT